MQYFRPITFSFEKTFESLEMFKHNPAFSDSDIHWQDMDQPLENIAAQFYNFYQFRPFSGDDVLIASFISDFRYISDILKSFRWLWVIRMGSNLDLKSHVTFFS